MKIHKIYSLITICLLITACDQERKPINYGEDQCAYCSMGIVKKTHAAQLVTTKGKQYKYDAIECMIDHKHENDSKFKDAKLFVADYGDPGKMTNAREATYLISKNLPSPMGANLTGFKEKAKAKKVQAEKSGKLLSWEALINKSDLKGPK